MDAKSAADRRKYMRLGTDQMISFAPVEASEQLGVGRDVSAGGIRFQAVGCEIELGDTIRVTFNLGEKTFVAVGRVVWAIDLDPITIDVGLEFMDIDPAALELLEREAETAPPV